MPAYGGAVTAGIHTNWPGRRRHGAAGGEGGRRGSGRAAGGISYFDAVFQESDAAHSQGGGEGVRELRGAWRDGNTAYLRANWRRTGQRTLTTAEYGLQAGSDGVAICRSGRGGPVEEHGVACPFGPEVADGAGQMQGRRPRRSRAGTTRAKQESERSGCYA